MLFQVTLNLELYFRFTTVLLKPFIRERRIKKDEKTCLLMPNFSSPPHLDL